MRKFFLISLISGLVCLVVANNALADGGIWLGFGATDSWDDAANWESGVPLPGDPAIVRFSETSVTHEPVIGAGVAATTGVLLLGDFNNTQPTMAPVTLFMTGGTLDGTGDFQLAISGGSANFDLSGGTATVPTLLLGHAGSSAQATTGTVNQSGGTFNIGTALLDFNSGAADDIGNYNLSGGLLAITTLGMGPEGLLDITNGTMTLAGDQIALVAFLESTGQITAFGGSGTVVRDFDVTTLGLTTVRAVDSSPADADFDGDGDIDGTDFLAWQRGFDIQSPNALPSDGDADFDLDVDGDDLAVWENQFGTTPLVGAVSAVPEPTSALLFGAGGMMLVALRRGRKTIA